MWTKYYDKVRRKTACSRWEEDVEMHLPPQRAESFAATNRTSKRRKTEGLERQIGVLAQSVGEVARSLNREVSSQSEDLRSGGSIGLSEEDVTRIVREELKGIKAMLEKGFSRKDTP